RDGGRPDTSAHDDSCRIQRVSGGDLRRAPKLGRSHVSARALVRSSGPRWPLRGVGRTPAVRRGTAERVPTRALTGVSPLRADGTRQLRTRRDPELWEDVVEVERDRARRQVELRTDLPVGEPARGQLRDLALLRGELLIDPASSCDR